MVMIYDDDALVPGVKLHRMQSTLLRNSTTDLEFILRFTLLSLIALSNRTRDNGDINSTGKWSKKKY